MAVLFLDLDRLKVVVARNVPSAEQADGLGKRQERAIRRPLNLDGVATRPSASVGVAWSVDPAIEPAELVARADAAMYTTKRHRHALGSRQIR